VLLSKALKGASLHASGTLSLCIFIAASAFTIRFVDKWLMTCFEPDWCSGCDLDKNGTVDSADLKRIIKRWLRE